MMDVKRIRELRLSRPFQPFTLILNDGRRLPVDVPYRLGISPKGGELAYASTGGPLFVSPSEVREIEMHATQKSGH
jgi:hypothetical protein